MKNLYIFTALIFLPLLLLADQVTMIVISIPENTPPGDDIYIAGSFNGWNPGDPTYMLQNNSSVQPEIVIEGTGTIMFKFTRGSWETVEGNENGGFLPDRTFTFGTTDTLEITILSWEDTGGTNHTAAENVIVMDEEFYMPQFDRYRRIWLYLPPDYENTLDNYAVLYMHDGQNLFDVATSFAGEWEVDETLNDLFTEGKEVPIVVGIDNGGTFRIDEYTPWVNSQYGGGDGELYMEFIVETLKPYIDENYRTKTEREFTGIMGSSLGGLISHYGGLKYQEIFSKAGIFSPSFWYSDSCYDFAYQMGKQHHMRLYMMGGTSESSTLIEEIEAMADTLVATGFDEEEIFIKAVLGGQHNEQLWREEFKQAYEWLFLEETNHIFPQPEKFPVSIVYANGILSVESHMNTEDNSMMDLRIFSVSGKLEFQTQITAGDSISIPRKLNGVYIIWISGDKHQIREKIFIPG